MRCIGDGDFKAFRGLEWLEWNVLKMNKRAILISAPFEGQKFNKRPESLLE